MTEKQPSPRSLALVPISVFVPGVGQCFFPKALRGTLVSEAELKRLYAKYVPKPQPMRPKP